MGHPYIKFIKFQVEVGEMEGNSQEELVGLDLEVVDHLVNKLFFRALFHRKKIKCHLTTAGNQKSLICHAVMLA